MGYAVVHQEETPLSEDDGFEMTPLKQGYSHRPTANSERCNTLLAVLCVALLCITAIGFSWALHTGTRDKLDRIEEATHQVSAHDPECACVCLNVCARTRGSSSD